MRHTIAAAAVAMLASSGSAYAADCTKGLLWPYVRNPGDCLTDQEVKTGVYQGAPQGSADVGSIKAPAQPVVPQDCHETGIWPFRSEECTPVATTSAKISAPPAPQPAVANTTAAAPAPVAQTAQPVARTQAASAPATTESTPAQAAAAAAQAAAAAAQAAAAAAQAAAAAAQAAAAAPAPVAMPGVVTQASPVPAPAPAQPAAATASCGKPLLWPFVRESGDCQTTIERTGGKSNPAPAQATASAQVAPAAMPAVVTQASSAPAPAAQPQAAAATASCGKSLFWPFVRDSGDCRTAVEKASGATDPVPVRASAAAQTPPVATPAVMQASPAAAQVQAAPANASCGKGLFWPFVRDSGDCATAVEKASDVTAPAATASQPAAAPAESGGCHKGVFWPFVREPGDCQTSSDKGQTH